MRKFATFSCMLLLLLAMHTRGQTTLNFTVNQTALPMAGFTEELQMDSLTFAFTDSSFGNILARKWTFGDGDSVLGNLTYVEHTYATKDRYEVCLEIFDPLGCTSKSCDEANHFVGINSPANLVERFDVLPNPFKDQAVIQYRLRKPAHVVLELYDMVGSRVSTLVNTHQDAGEQRAILLGGQVEHASGICFLRLTVDGKTQMKKVVELH